MEQSSNQSPRVSSTNKALHAYYFFMKAFATTLLITTGLVIAVNYPGSFDVLNGVTVGVSLFAIWFAKERQA